MDCEIASINADPTKFKAILQNSKTIAVIGCSPNPQKDSNMVARYLLDVGFEMIPVYPKEEEILGQKVYRSLKDIDKSVDMVVVFRKPAVVTDVVEAAIQKGGIKYLWTQIGIVNNEAAQKAVDNCIEVVQNRCIMVEHRNL